jgi:protease-4
MAKARTWFLGAGCLLVIFGVVIVSVLVRGLSAPSLPREIVISMRLAGPIAEVTAEDPLGELMGDQATSMRRLREALVRAAEDDRVSGLRVRIDSIGGGIATAQEIRTLIERFSAAGKWTAAYIDTAGEFGPGNFVYYVASACDEVVMNPQGDVNLIGLSSRVRFIRGAFDKLEIKAEFPGRGDYKTARFMYTQRDFTPAHREMMGWLLDSIMEQLMEGIGSSRDLDPAEVANLVDRAPFLGEEAVEVGLIDRVEDWGAFTEGIEERTPRARAVNYKSYLKRGDRTTRGARIAVVTAVGAIMRGSSQESINPLFGGTIMGSDTIAAAFRAVRKTAGVKAVVFRIDSGGGSAIASEIIRQEMVRTAEEIPVVVSMSNVAGSGGYWITCGAHRIVADPATITGSIGVYGGHLNMDGFWSKKLGVTYGRLDTGANANLYGSLEDWTDAQRAVIDRQLDRIYDDFVARVAASRDMTPDAVDAIGRGRVFTGKQALENGLIDVVGGFDVALNEAKALAGIDPDEDVRLVEFPRMQPWWRQFAKKSYSDDAAVREALKSVTQWMETGFMEPPGVVWMPPIEIQ